MCEPATLWKKAKRSILIVSWWLYISLFWKRTTNCFWFFLDPWKWIHKDEAVLIVVCHILRLAFHAKAFPKRKHFLPPFYNRAKPSRGLIGERCPPDRIWAGKRLHPKRLPSFELNAWKTPSPATKTNSSVLHHSFSSWALGKGAISLGKGLVSTWCSGTHSFSRIIPAECVSEEEAKIRVHTHSPILSQTYQPENILRNVFVRPSRSTMMTRRKKGMRGQRRFRV